MEDNRQQERGIEKSFHQLLEKTDRALTIEEIMAILAGRGYPFLLILFSLPFCQPIQIPGLSTPFGVLIIFIGLRMAFGHRIWLPRSLLNKQISKEIIHKVSDKGLWLTGIMTKFTSPRLVFLINNPIFHICNGITISLLGLILALPLPIPLSNLIVAWAILLMSVGLLEDDGVFLIIGYLIGALSLVALIFLVSFFL